MNLIELTYVDVAVSASLVVLAGLVSLLLRLGITFKLGVAALRTIVQLLLLGLVLEWVFALQQWWLVVALLVSMVLNAGIAGVRRSSRRFPGVWSTGFIAVTVSCVTVTFVVTEVVVGVDPWWTPRYLIPLMGMVLGNTLTGLSLSLDRVMADLDTRRLEVEGLLALGASGWEACRSIVSDAVRTGMTPILNSMTVVGIVSLPGMMTGQLLAGSSPMDAVKYQIVVMFMIAAASTLGSLLAATLAFRHLVTPQHQLAAHRLQRT